MLTFTKFVIIMFFFAASASRPVAVHEAEIQELELELQQAVEDAVELEEAVEAELE